jgi:hypothetical protein
MRRSTDLMRRVAIMLACAVATASCASGRDATTKTKTAAVTPKAKRKLTAAELREKDLIASIEKARAKKLEPRALSKVEALAMHEISELRFNRGDEPGAVAAIERAVRNSWFVDDPALFKTVRSRELAIKRAIAIRTADRGNYLDALGMLDQLKVLDRLTSEDQKTIAGDRLLVLDKRSESGASEEDITEEVATLDRLLGVSVFLEEITPEIASTTNTRTGTARHDEQVVPLGNPKNGLSDASAGQIEKHETSADLPGADDMPLVETGTIDLKTVSQMLVLHRRSIESCYSRALRAGNKPSGKLEVDINVEPTGDVSDADVRTREFTGTELARCVTSAIRRWKFPPIEEAKRMTVPFVLGRAF